MELIHNDGPEHWCGMCRIGHPTPPKAHGNWLEHLIARCIVKGIITDAGARFIWTELGR